MQGAPDPWLHTNSNHDIEAMRVRAEVENRLFKQSQPNPLTLGRYQLGQKIGMGGMGIVYRAYDPELERWVALKLLNEQKLITHVRAQAKQRLILEAKSMAKLSHANIVQIYDVGAFSEQVFIAMELIDGLNLQQWIDEKKPTWEQIFPIFLAAGEALLAAHRMGVVHRDFKPENVLVGTDGRVKVVDFGLCRLLDETAEKTQNPHTSALIINPSQKNLPSLTQTDTLLGTPRYMAPEQILGRSVDARADQFSFCVALYEAVYHQPPFLGTEVQEHLSNVIEGNLCSPAIRSHETSRLWPILQRGLANNSEDRFLSMQELLTEIQKLRSDTVPSHHFFPLTKAWFWRFTAIFVCVIIGITIGIYNQDFLFRSQQKLAFRATIKFENFREKINSLRKQINPVETESVIEHQANLHPSEPPSSKVPMRTEKQPQQDDWCSMHEDHYTLINRNSKRRRFIHDSQGVCYQCRIETRATRIQRFYPVDCANYQVCRPAEQTLCL